LKFESPELSSNSASPTAEVILSSAPQNSFASVSASRESVAMDCAATEAVVAARHQQVVEAAAPKPVVVHRPEHVAKIIEFPRPAYEPPVITNDLAEPIFDRPRILEAPEVVPPPPALGGITIEEVAKAEPERRPGIDMPLHPAPLEQRFAAMMIDGLVVAIAMATFSAIYYQLTRAQPPITQLLGIGGGLLGFFSAAYQYLLVVYSGTTLGLRAMKLQLLRFDGSPARPPLRRWRVLASWLSAVSLGMGYLWQFLDEDGLCWHERVTKTYVASGRKPHVLLQNPPVRE
jgi:uncharacterized RDD family membrane protein YckC